ncbi:PREDICTED: uncharacterized protein LOC18607118 isoform X2 [Theobroma cacao]|uniref:Uncharacterized protein LOC18607118 isoform X2 n=1 Tax=Theobroma cacao TaxID=3641 RepID=A0AB32VVQ0_THECC|nr:PREDICTED: uncharacterized protein LOC18607118 isoform X2 [Theobroma cacao]
MFCFCSIVFYYFVELFFISAEVTAAPPATPLPSCLPRFFTTLSSSPSSSLSLTTLSVFFLPLSITARSQPSSYLFRASQLVRIVFLWSFLDRFQEIVAFEDFLSTGGHLWALDWPLAGIHNTTKPYLVATDLLYRVTWMLWFINGWSWSNAIPNVPPRSIAAAAGYRRGQVLSEAKRG